MINWLVVPIVGGFTIALFMDTNELEAGNWSLFIESAMLSSAYWAVLGNGNDWMVHLLNKRWTWLEAPLKRALVGVAAMFVFTLMASLIIVYLFVTFRLGLDFWKLLVNGDLNRSLTIPLFITIIFALWGHGHAFLIEWRQAAIDVERLKTENLKSKFESLKSQVNPHFLFNSLNALSSLVYTDQDRAADFIQKLADVYRYVLDHQNDELVSLRDEIEFLKSYVYLNQIRFGNNLRVTYQNVDESEKNWMIPPVALQMLMENALKHNEVSTEFPLDVQVIKKSDNIWIINNLNPIYHPKSDAGGLGLTNVKERFAMMTDEKVLVEKTNTHFRVQVPLLTVQA